MSFRIDANLPATSGTVDGLLAVIGTLHHCLQRRGEENGHLRRALRVMIDEPETEEAPIPLVEGVLKVRHAASGKLFIHGVGFKVKGVVADWTKGVEMDRGEGDFWSVPVQVYSAAAQFKMVDNRGWEQGENHGLRDFLVMICGQ